MGYKKLTDEQLADALQRIVHARRKTEREIEEGRGDMKRLYGFLGELVAEKAKILEEMRRRQPQQYIAPR
ncbi:hypothetical protein MarSH_154 [Marseillevirus Shanghai 1]|nr:hypothetical protein MarSH_154 [Marseillevirus Shanghai 1]